MDSATASASRSDPAAPFDVVVIGAGIAGLAAAWELRDARIAVLEADGRVGGRLKSERRGAYWLNYGGHVLSGPDSSTGQLLRSVGVNARDVPGVLTAVALGDRLLAGRRVETYPFRLALSASERLALARVGARLRFEVERYRRAIAPRSDDSDATLRERTLAFRADQTFSEFLGPLPPRVDGILRATIRRSSGEPEQVAAGYGIGYFQLVWDRAGGLTRNILGGSSMLPQAIAETLGERIVLGAAVDCVRCDGDEVVVEYRQAGQSQVLRARHAVLATPADVTRAIAPDLPPATARALASVTYGPYVVGAFLTSEPGPGSLDGTYAMATPERSFNMLFNTANVLRTGQRQPGGTLMVYSGAELARALDGLDDDAVARTYTKEVVGMLPELRGKVAEVRIQRWPRGLPHPRPGRAEVQAELEKPLGRLHLAGDYLGTRYVETAISTGIAAAQTIRAQLRTAAEDRASATPLD